MSFATVRHISPHPATLLAHSSSNPFIFSSDRLWSTEKTLLTHKGHRALRSLAYTIAVWHWDKDFFPRIYITIKNMSNQSRCTNLTLRLHVLILFRTELIFAVAVRRRSLEPHGHGQDVTLYCLASVAWNGGEGLSGL